MYFKNDILFRDDNQILIDLEQVNKISDLTQTNFI